MAKLAFCDYHNMVAILEKTEHNVDFHQIVDFLEASHIRTVQLFESMLVPQGEGSENPTEPHHTPSAQYESTPQEDQTTSPEPIPQATTLPSQSHPDISTPRRLTRGAIRISQSKAPTPGADETASPTRDDRHGEAFPTATSLDAGQDRENIAKTSAMPHEASPGVTSLGGGEGSMQQKLQELMDMCTNLQQQHLLMEQRIQSQDLEITQLKNRVKTLEDNEKRRVGFAQEDAPNTGGMDQGEDLMTRDVEKSTGKGSDNTDEAANVLSTLEAANVLSSGSFPTAAPAGVATASGSFPTAAIFTTASVTTPYTRRTRASRGIIIEPSHTTSVPTISEKEKGKEKMVEEEQLIKEQGEKDAKIARAQAEKELGMMIAELDRSNALIAKYMTEYKQAEADLSLEEKMELITELINHAGWKSKDFKGMTFEQIEEKFIPVWKQLQDFMPMNYKTESERVKRPGIQLAQESSKRLKTAKASRSEPSQENQIRDSKELSEEELKKMMEIVPIEEVYIEALQEKYPIIECTTNPTDDKENELWVELKRLYEPDPRDQLWALQRYMHDPLE
ncbi:hypothetical protein Tco_0238046 [Tanacetum coccineum]